MRGDLLAAEWDGYVNRFHLNAAGTAVAEHDRRSSPTSSVHPLDLTTTGDNGPFPGTIWLADHVSGDIFVFEPNDFGGGGATCTGADNATLDEDGDGYTNADEIDNGTEPVLGRRRAAGLGRRPRLEPATTRTTTTTAVPDTSDPWAIDGANGTTTPLPVSHPFDDTSTPAPVACSTSGSPGS